jgi:hypothetical protein
MPKFHPKALSVAYKIASNSLRMQIGVEIVWQLKDFSTTNDNQWKPK